MGPIYYKETKTACYIKYCVHITKKNTHIDTKPFYSHFTEKPVLADINNWRILLK